MTTICNPMDLPYRLQHLTVGPFYNRTCREAADPSMVMFGDRYYLFPSMSGGFFHSTDLVAWEFVATPTLPTYDYAPDVREINGQLVVCASKGSGICDFYRSSDPLAGSWEHVRGTLNFFDPNLFEDDDGRVYLYQGCGNKKPINGQELDPSTLHAISDRVDIIAADTSTRGWERNGENFTPNDTGMSGLMTMIAGTAPYIEGAWMTKHEGTYYLQYAAPGTQVNAYSDGYNTAAAPLGPFTYSPHSPFSSKPGGFMPAAGHGSTMQDRYGNWWHIATMRISKNFMFERRLGLWPAGFDSDGNLFCNQEFGDYPMTIPTGPADPWSLSAKAMLLSYGRPVTCSSANPNHGAELAVDEDCQTWWVAGGSRPGEWLSVDLPAGASTTHVQLNLAEHKVVAPKGAKKQRTLLWNRHVDLTDIPVEVTVEGSVEGRSWEMIIDTRGAGSSRTHLYVELPDARPYRQVKVTGYSLPHGARLAVSGLRVFGHGAGAPPAAVVATGRRSGPMNIDLRWAAVAGAQGYNVRYGLTPETLYHSWLLYDRTSLDLASINAGYDYWVAVDSFNENGITRGTPIHVPAHSTVTSGAR